MRAVQRMLCAHGYLIPFVGGCQHGEQLLLAGRLQHPKVRAMDVPHIPIDGGDDLERCILLHRNFCLAGQQMYLLHMGNALAGESHAPGKAGFPQVYTPLRIQLLAMYQRSRQGQSKGAAVGKQPDGERMRRIDRFTPALTIAIIQSSQINSRQRLLAVLLQSAAHAHITVGNQKTVAAAG